MVLANLIGGFIVIIVGLNLLPTVAGEIGNATDAVNVSVVNGTTTNWSTPNVTGASAAILDLTTVFFALGIMSSGIAITLSGLKEAGLA